MKLFFTDGDTHVPGAINDMTLCGLAYEGMCDGNKYKNKPNEFEAVEPSESKIITCKHCCQIIEHVRSIPRSFKLKP